MKWTSTLSDRLFVCYFHFIGLDHISLGFHINWKCPNIELHVPFGFFRIGWSAVYRRTDGPVRSIGKTAWGWKWWEDMYN